jgi:hypothetical protein
MIVSSNAGRRLSGLAMCLGLATCLGLAGCIQTAPQGDGLFYRPPESVGQASVATAKTPAEVAQVLQGAGLGKVRADARSVTLVSNDPRLVDCGTFIQVALGNRAEFPANAPDAVLMQGFGSPGLMQRGVDTASTVRLTRLADGTGYAIAERHTVTRHYQTVATGAKSSSSASFNEASSGTFPNKTACTATGLVAALLR